MADIYEASEAASKKPPTGKSLSHQDNLTEDNEDIVDKKQGYASDHKPGQYLISKQTIYFFL